MNTSRRGFLGGIFAAGAAPMIMNSGCCSFKSNRIVNIGVIGYGRIASTFEVPCVLRRREKARIVAVCDLDSKRAQFGKERITSAYRDGSKIDVYHDYKELCARKDIDAVMICLPDFWHALVATTAICSGKAVWLQKPFTQTVQEGRLLANLAKKYNTVMQVGSQQRSWNVFQCATAIARSGEIGKIKKVEVGIGIDVAGGCRKAEKVPANFDYDTWLGPTDHNVPYNWTRCHNDDLKHIGDRPGWIQLAPYGWGMITNWGAHHLDVSRWGLGAKGPEKVEGTCEWMDMSGDKLWNVHTSYDLHYSFNNGFTDCHVCDKYQMGVKFIGENGWSFCTRGAAKVTPSDPDPVVRPGQLGPIECSNPELIKKYIKPMYSDAMQEHIDNWLDAVAAEDPSMTLTNAEGGHLSTSMCSLGQMCMELGRGKKSFSLDWDADKECSKLAEANKLTKPFANGKFDLNVNLAEFGLKMADIMG